MRRLLCLLAVVLAPAGAAAGEPGYLTREVELKAAPSHSAATLARLPKDSRVEVLLDQRAWAQVKAGSVSGWTLGFYVMKGEPAASAGLGKRLSEAWSLGTERSTATSATIGVRGLDEEDLKSAKFDEHELRRLEGLTMSPSEATRFAKQGGLVVQSLGYFPPPRAQHLQPADASLPQPAH